MHVHPSSPEYELSTQPEESAAIKIQAGFRGYRVRKQLHYYYQTRRVSNRRQQKHQQINMHQGTSTTADISAVPSAQSLSRTDDSIEHRCATKIQASVRGFLVRKKQKIATDAATKIQASFRGFKARKETQKLKQK